MGCPKFGEPQQKSSNWLAFFRLVLTDDPRLHSFIGILVILLWPVIRGILCESWSVHIARSNQNGQNTKDHQKLATMTRVTEFWQLQLDRTKVTKYVRTDFTSHASRQLLPIHHHSSDVKGPQPNRMKLWPAKIVNISIAYKRLGVPSGNLK